MPPAPHPASTRSWPGRIRSRAANSPSRGQSQELEAAISAGYSSPIASAYRRETRPVRARVAWKASYSADLTVGVVVFIGASPF
ncbi:hypothetical protein ACWDYJ_15395 [Streptomyces sp. NPDC003042]